MTDSGDSSARSTQDSTISVPTDLATAVDGLLSTSIVPASISRPTAFPTGLPSSLGYVPEDPFLPKWPSQAPVFLDTGACICALRNPPDNSTNQVWECQGNATSNPYTTTSGKWFNAPNAGNLSTALDDASNPPETDNPLVTSNGSTLVPLASIHPNPLSLFDQACTGINLTHFSTSYYQATQAIAQRQPPIAAAPCWREGAVSIPLIDASAWQNETTFIGCKEGFFCPNNTINSLPQYCYPLAPCAKARLAGIPCDFRPTPNAADLNIGMGPFEPVMCTAGYYCPKNATEQMQCPAGSYCPSGSQQAIKCSAGSSCHAGSQNEVMLIPFVLIIIVDVLLIIIFQVHSFRKRRRLHQQGSAIMPTNHKSPALPSRSFLPYHKPTKERHGYAKLDDPEAEIIQMESTIKPLKRVPTGFQAALDEAYLQNDSSKKELDIDSSVELRQFVGSMGKAIHGSNFGLGFDFEKLSFQPKGSSKPILSNISGSIAVGSLIGVMGGSGAGKSTFVNVLMGTTTHTGGLVKVNGVATKMKRYRKIIGYVPQDDIVLPELTVRENILHSARIRLPSKWSETEVQTHADAVVDCLDLTHVRDSKVGSIAAPIISGGQRKRVSIGMELAAAPMAIFLDEPTSGLDATAASSIMKTLKALSHLGMTIVVIIHQPRVEIFEMIDDLILLGNGRLIFQGSESSAQPYFASLGFDFPAHSNAGDIITDIITGNGRPYKRSGDTSKEALIEHWESIQTSHPHRDSLLSSKSESASLHASIKGRGAPLWRQYYFCLARAMLQQHRALSSFWFEMGVASFGGFLIGLAQNGQKGHNFQGFFLDDYYILSSAIDYKSIPTMALLVCISIGLIAAAPGVRVFGDEYLIYRREAGSGHGRFAYYMAKVTSTFPRLLFACVHFTTFFMLLATPRIGWWAAFVANLFYFYCIYGLASVVSVVVRQTDGPLFAVMASLIVGVLSGAAPPLAKVQTWHLAWLWKCSPGVWLAEIYFGQNVLPLAYLYDVKGASIGTGFRLDAYGFDLGALLVIGTIYRVVAFGGLLISTRGKR